MLKILSSIFYLWIINAFFSSLFTPKDHSQKIRWGIWVLFYLSHFFILSNVKQAIWNFIIGYMLIFILCILLYKGSYKRMTFFALAIYLLGMIIEICVAIPFLNAGYSISDISFIGSIISKLILLAFVHGITIFKFQHAHAEPATTYWILLLTTTISSILIIHTIFLLTQSVSSKSLKNLSSLSIIILLFLNITLFIIYNKLSLSSDLHTKNTVLQQQIHDYNDLIMQIKEHHSSYSCEKHNLKNQLIAIRSYAFQGQNKQIITFINSLLTNKDFGLTPQSYCTNIVLDSLLCSKRPLIQQFDITYTVNVSVPTVLPFDDIDLCIIIGNALDNAFESVTLNKIENPFVSVNIQYKNNTLYCHFQNTYVHKLHPTADFLFKSTKASSHHGYGLYSIQKTVTKYDGICKIFTEHEVFDLKILLYLPKPTSS